MATIHGNWLHHQTKASFFIWGETWRKLEDERVKDHLLPYQAFKKNASEPETLPVIPEPFCSTREELIRSLEQDPAFSAGQLPLFIKEKPSERWTQEIVYLPSEILSRKRKKYLCPLLSGQFSEDATLPQELVLAPYAVEGFALTPKETLTLFSQLSLGELYHRSWGEEFIFWFQLYRWSLDLLTRRKFIPSFLDLESASRPDEKENIQGIWLPLLDSFRDQKRLATFTQTMPFITSAYQMNQEHFPDYQLKYQGQRLCLKEPQSILLSFLTHLLDQQLKDWTDFSLPSNKNLFVLPWLKGLSQPKSLTLALTDKEKKQLNHSLINWTYSIQDYIPNPYSYQLPQNDLRTALKLTPPDKTKSGDNAQLWQLKYYLQAVDDEDFLISATTIWQEPVSLLKQDGREIQNPQETLLKGLGRSARIYKAIATSLTESRPTHCDLDPIQVYEFIRSTAGQLKDRGLGIILPPGLESGAGENRLGVSIVAGVSPRKSDRLGLKSLLQYQLRLAVGDQVLSKQDFEQLLQQQSPLVEIEGKWIALQPTDVRSAQMIVNQTHDQVELTVENALRLATGETKTLAKLPIANFKAEGILEELIQAFIHNESIQILPTPKSLQGALRPYQNRGMSWLSFLDKWGLGACLADDMGLGKTIQLISFLLKLQEEKALTYPTLIICPTSVLNNWEREIQKFSPSLSVLIHHGENRKKGQPFVKQVKEKNVVLTSYSLVFRDEKTLNLVQWQGVVLDEAQNIKNPQAKQSQAVRKLNAGFRIALTGTPVENRLSELWSILDFLNPGILGNRTFFQRRFALPIEKYGDQDSLRTLRSLVQPFILRRLKTDQTIIQDLPEKQEMNVFCGLSSEQAQLYQQLVDQSLVKIDSATGIQRHGLILNLLVKLKQLCNHPALILKEKQLENSQRSGKLLRLEEMLEESITEGDRSLIFTQFAEWGKLLQAYLTAKLGYNIPFLYGATRRQQRQEMVDQFQNDPEASPIFILSLKAGGTGLNLTRANHVFHVDRWWNPAVENQATDRAFRIGQKRNVQVHKFICTGTLEEKINDLIESKKQLAEQTVDAGEQWLTEMDTDQLRNLLLLDRDQMIDS